MAGYKKSFKRLAADADGDTPQKKAKFSKGAKGVAKGKASKSESKSEAPEPFWELSAKRRVTVSDFKGNHLISIREYYEKDGDMLPGQKGISLTVEQYEAFVKSIPAINAALLDKGVKLDVEGNGEDSEPHDDEEHVKGEGVDNEEDEDED